MKIYKTTKMKKITLFALLFAAFQMNAQVIMSENFDSALNWSVVKLSGTSTNPGWSSVSDGTNPDCIPYSGAGMAKFASYDIVAANPANVFALTSPSFSLVGSNFYSVKFAMYRDNGYNTDADKIDVHMVSTATTAPSAATLLGTVHRSMALSPVVAAEGWYVYQFNIPAATAGNRFIRLVATSQYGNNTFVDAVSVQQLAPNDLGMQSISLGSTIVGNAPSAITGSFRNNGSSAVNSAVLNWQVDNGVVNTQNLTGLNVASGATYNFSHSVTWSPTVGLYNLKVWVTSPNGLTDSFLADNELIKVIRVASNSTTRRPLLEKFTSSTCGPCAGYNANMFTPYYNANSNNVSLINYQVNWPGAGDPYYTAETGTRRNYYQVTAAPTLFIDSKAAGSGSTSALQSEVNGYAAVPGYFLLSATKNLVGSTMNVTVNTTPYLTGQFRLHVVVVEKTTTGNVATNGETSFKNVMMKMMPDANGTILNCTANTMISTGLSINLASTFIEEYTDLDVIVFVQDFNSKEIMNSGIATQQLSNESFDVSKIKVYPNPSNGIFTVDTDLPTEVKVLDITGKVVFTGFDITKQNSINVSNLQQGVYLLKIKNDLGEQTEKIVIK
jgi:hypothetical protein